MSWEETPDGGNMFGGLTGEVRWDTDCYGLYCPSLNKKELMPISPTTMSSFFEQLEVIGNIHENPELLEEEE
jgi:hypothetical protein